MASHGHERKMDSIWIDGAQWTRGRNAIVFVVLVSWVAAIAGYLSDPKQFLQSYLVGFLFAVSVPLGALFFVMIQYLTGSAWSVPLRRIAENLMVTIPAGLVLFLPVAVGAGMLYSWADPAIASKDHLIQAKQAFLNLDGFRMRGGIFFLLWTLFAYRIYRNSTQQDKTGDLKHMHTISRWSAPGLLIAVLSVSLASFDWVMSLDPHWYSTIFGLYFYAGCGLAFLSTWTLICLAFRAKGILAHSITVEHYHDLGKWMFAITVFYAYISFSQYLLIWYANIPEETIFYKERLTGSWTVWSALLLFGRFIIPFVVLLFRASKRNLTVLRVAAVWILLMQFVDLYWLVMPNFQHHGVHLHWMDAACLVAPTSLMALVFWQRVKQHALMPVGDPRFDQGMAFQNL